MDLDYLRRSRASAKGYTTKKINELKDLMRDSVLNNYYIVNERAYEFEDAVGRFHGAHQLFHSELNDLIDIEESDEYWEKEMQRIDEFREDLNRWLNQARIEIQISPPTLTETQIEDSASKINRRAETTKTRNGSKSSKSGSNSHTKSRSRTSKSPSYFSESSSEARARCAAKKASLLAEIAAQNSKRALLDEELQLLREETEQRQRKLQLEQKREELALETELAKAQAEELAYKDIEQTDQGRSSSDMSLTTIISSPKNKATKSDQQIKSSQQRLLTTNHQAVIPKLQQPCLKEEPDSARLHDSHVKNVETLVNLQLQQIMALQLPQTTIQTFDGSPLEYYPFTNAFDNLIESRSNNNSTRLYYLVQYTSGEVNELMKSCLMMHPDRGYPEARKLLKEKFGNPHCIATAFIDKITKEPPIKAEDASALRRLSILLTSCKNTLQDLNYLHKVNNPDTLHKIIERLPFNLRSNWRDVADKLSEVQHKEITIEDIANFVETKARALSHPIFGKIVQEAPKTYTSKSKIYRPSSNFMVSASTTEGRQSTQSKEEVINKNVPECPNCDDRHWLAQCPAFKKLSLNERFQFVRRMNLCDNCLLTGHLSSSCPKSSFCKVQDCKGKHSTFIHGADVSMLKVSTDDQPDSSNNADIPRPTEDEQPKKVQCQSHYVKSQKSLHGSNGAGRLITGLPIVPVKVKARGKNIMIETYALLDTGSSNTFCSERLIKQLQADTKKATLLLTTLDRCDFESTSLIANLEVFDMEESNLVELPSVYSRPDISVPSENIPLQQDVESWDHLRGITVQEIDAKVELLIGNDVPTALEPLQVKQSCNGGPYACKTRLGWAINGPMKTICFAGRQTVNFVQADADLEKQFKDFYNLEFNDCQDFSKSMSIEDMKALAIMEESTKLKDGHYEVAIPWRCTVPNLPNNKTLAEHRLSLLRRRLLKDEVLRVKYTAFMEDLFDKDYARRVPEENLNRNDGKVWYLPHHNVVQEKKPDKTRVVFDCSARYGGTSLNQQILQGPDLTNSLVGTLTRFRKDLIAITSDVESMFYQVKVPLADADALRFLWWPNGDLETRPQECQMLVHLFGGISSPSCANYSLRKTADDSSDQFSAEAVYTVKRNFYVDDCLKSVPSEEQASNLASELRELLSRGGFRLTKWLSNSKKVIESIPETERSTKVKGLSFSELPMERALGVAWNVERDTFTFQKNLKKVSPTRKGLLSVVSSLYDPLGLIAPFVFPAKLLLQDLCRRGAKWDDNLSTTELQQWNLWQDQLEDLEDLEVPRCFKPSNFDDVITRELHNFSDASQAGYGAVCYMRTIDACGRINVSFVIGKSRVAPLKHLTIPRLELSAAVLAVKLNSMVTQELDDKIEEPFFWTDSSCVLGYINNTSKRYKTFVANRISTIHEHSTPSQWNFISTELNPADCASRGQSSKQLLESKEWINGPSFLLQSRNTWPQQPEFNTATAIEETDPDPELKQESCSMYTLSTNNEKNPLLSTITKYSSWTKLRRVIALVLRYIHNLNEAVKKTIKYNVNSTMTPIDVTEMKAAEIAILQTVQRNSFHDEINALIKGNLTNLCPIKKSSPTYKLCPFLDNDGLMKVGGRLSNAAISEQSKHQVILPKKSHVVDIIIQHCHERSGHLGLEYVLSETREKYWILNARKNIKRILFECRPCRRRKTPAGNQVMADLPKDRVTPDQPPFTNVGVDCFGPFHVRRGRSQVKRYGILFTCLTIRAIHIEIAHSLNTDSFINALRRFISRRGTPKVIRSDNGGNFVAGNKEIATAMQEWNQQQIHSYLLQREIQWKFNPPYGSHHGGVWERCIRSVRNVLSAVLKEQTIDDESLSTLMCEVESILNGRPLTKASDDPTDPEALTPNHILLLRHGSSIPPGLFTKEDNYTRRRWRQVQYLADVFWRRWTREYLPTLQMRQKWIQPQRNFAVGDIVLLADEHTPRNTWPLARIVQVYPGKDGKVRRVKTQSRQSQQDRPISKIVLLEISSQ